MPHPRLFYLSVAYTVSMLAWFALRVLLFDTLWWLALLNTVALWLFLPLPLLLVAALARRAWHAARVLLLPLLLFGWLFGPRCCRRCRTRKATMAPRCGR